ncbi:MAG: ABC transporter ATP-binding protein [Desulfobacteraceae bacterium]|nr:ABC transporter ATP-binding protein [Desulfobacteraceae bacterium]
MIEINQLSKRYGAKSSGSGNNSHRADAVKNLSLSIPKGELFCFLGPNGAGKTTTIKILTGLLRASSGSVLINGTDPEKDHITSKRIIGYIPDMPYLYERLTTTEFFEFTGELYDIDKDIIDEKLEDSFALFGLIEYKNVLVKDLSHGLRQRLIYAATFLHDPEILFIDEPLIGLDPYTIRLIKDLLKEKARNGMTIFLTTHILALAEDIAHRIGIILRGELVELGTLSELYEKHGKDNLEDIFLSLTEN